MKDLDFLKHADHSRKAAMYAAEHDGKVRHFAYHEELGECRETFIQAVKQHKVLIGDHSHDLVYDLREEEDEAQFRGLYPQGEYEKARSAPRPLVDAIAQSPFAAASLESGQNWFLVTRIEGKAPDDLIYSLSSGARGQAVDVFGLGRWKELLDILAPYGITEEGGWCPVPPERKDWLSRTQQQEDAMAAQTAAAMKPHRASLPKGAHVRVILPESGKSRSKRRRKRGGRNI